MQHSKNLRVVIFCLGFETVKVLQPIDYYKADKAYMLCMTKGKGYKAFRNEVVKQIKKKGIEFQELEMVVYQFGDCLKELYKIIDQEKLAGNHVYVNIFGTPAYSAAAMVACMMKDAIPFFAGTKKYTIEDPKEFFVSGKPVGISSEVWEPLEIPTFHLEPPKEDVIKALKILKERKDKKWFMTDSAIIEDLHKNGLMKDVFEKGRTKVTQKAKMQYRRRFLEKWLKKQWVEQYERGKYKLTDYGEVVVEVF